MRLNPSLKLTRYGMRCQPGPRGGRASSTLAPGIPPHRSQPL